MGSRDCITYSSSTTCRPTLLQLHNEDVEHKLRSFHSHENVLNAASILSLEKTVVIYSEREHEILLALGNLLGQPVNA